MALTSRRKGGGVKHLPDEYNRLTVEAARPTLHAPARGAHCAKTVDMGKHRTIVPAFVPAHFGPACGAQDERSGFL